MRGIVTVTVREEQFYMLRPDVVEMFRLYGTHLAGPNRDTLCIELPEYRWQEIRAQLPAEILES